MEGGLSVTDNAHRSVQLDSTSSAEINNGKNEHIGIIGHLLGREMGEVVLPQEQETELLKRPT